jgi:membrane protein
MSVAGNCLRIDALMPKKIPENRGGQMFGIKVSANRYLKDLYHEISEDNISNGAAALSYYITFALFPAMIFLLSVLPYLPIANLQQSIMEFLSQALPGQAAQLLSGTLAKIMASRQSGLLSFGALATLWAGSAGVVALIQQLNITYDVKEDRSFINVRAIAVGLTFALGLLMIGAFTLIILGGQIQNWLISSIGGSAYVMALFSVLRWIIIAGAILLAFALTYYFAPNVEQKFVFITPGSVVGTIVIGVASLAFKFYVENFGDYDATYGSIGAMIILMLWLYITGLVILLGSEVNALAEHYSPEGKNKGEKHYWQRHSSGPLPKSTVSP